MLWLTRTAFPCSRMTSHKGVRLISQHLLWRPSSPAKEGKKQVRKACWGILWWTDQGRACRANAAWSKCLKKMTSGASGIGKTDPTPSTSIPAYSMVRKNLQMKEGMPTLWAERRGSLQGNKALPTNVTGKRGWIWFWSVPVECGKEEDRVERRWRENMFRRCFLQAWQVEYRIIESLSLEKTSEIN